MVWTINIPPNSSIDCSWPRTWPSTPDIQLIINPALDPTEDSIWVFALRARLAL